MGRRLNIFAGFTGAIIVMVFTLTELGPQALFWSPIFLVEGFAWGFVAAWCGQRILLLVRRWMIGTG